MTSNNAAMSQEKVNKIKCNFVTLFDVAGD